MAFQFPANPTVGQTYIPSAGITFKWNGTAWYLVNSTLLTPTEADTRYVQIANARSMESRIINGNFAIDQRNAGSVLNVNTSGIYTLDRWISAASGGGVLQFFRSPDAEQSGEFYLSAAVQTVDASLAAPDNYFVGQRIEGHHVADLNFGSAAAETFTFAFDVSSSIAGTFPVSFRNNAGDRNYIKTFTVAAGTLTPIAMTIPGDTTGVWDKGSNVGLSIVFGFGFGSNFIGSATNVWQSGNFLSVAGCTNLMATAGAGMVIRRVRLYPGAIDYGPCQRLYSDELRLCQRYFEKSYDIGTVPGAATNDGAHAVVMVPGVATMNKTFLISKRVKPSITFYNHQTGATGTWYSSSSGGNVATMTSTAQGESSFLADAAGITANSLLVGHWTASAEL